MISSYLGCSGFEYELIRAWRSLYCGEERRFWKLTSWRGGAEYKDRVVSGDGLREGEVRTKKGELWMWNAK